MKAAVRELRDHWLVWALLSTGAFLWSPGAGADCRDDGDLDAATRPQFVVPEPDRAALDRWCRAVGTAVLQPFRDEAPSDGFGRLVAVSWNTKGGWGDLELLIRDLRAGRLTDGEPVAHFALMLQEAVRVGGSIPESVGHDGASAASLSRSTRPERSVEAVAERTGLNLFYAPSMRNGADLREDRGNAILATLPLREPVVIELPYERQRRAAVMATVALPVGDEHVPLRLVSAHFDNTSKPSRFWRSFGAGRARQARGLLEAIPEDAWVVLGGDFNTWFREASEPVVAVMTRRFGRPATLPKVHTYMPPYGYPRRQVDYLMADIPDHWKTGYHPADDWRNSDHAPLVGWLEPTETP